MARAARFPCFPSRRNAGLDVRGRLGRRSRAPDARIVVARAGTGGLGNKHFASRHAKPTPRFAEVLVARRRGARSTATELVCGRTLRSSASRTRESLPLLVRCCCSRALERAAEGGGHPLRRSRRCRHGSRARTARSSRAPTARADRRRERRHRARPRVSSAPSSARKLLLCHVIDRRGLLHERGRRRSGARRVRRGGADERPQCSCAEHIPTFSRLSCPRRLYERMSVVLRGVRSNRRRQSTS